MKRLLGVKRALRLIDSMKKARVLVVGDLIMDHFIWGSVARISPEAPVPVVNVTKETIVLGGAANVAHNVRGLGGKCSLIGVIGKDFDGRRLLKDVRAIGMRTEGIVVDEKRHTTIKTRIVAHHQQVVRFDRETSEHVRQATREKLYKKIERGVKDSDVVIISDYAKGLIDEQAVSFIRECAERRKVPVAVDPKVEHMDYYWGLTVVTPNANEAQAAVNLKIKDEVSLRKVGLALLDKLGSDAVLITRGEHGMSLFDDGSETHIPTVAKEVYDVSGAGDTVIAVMALSIAAGADFREAAVLSNLAGGVVVEKLGTATVTPEELKAALKTRLNVRLPNAPTRRR